MTEENQRANARAEVRKARQALAAADRLIESGLFEDAVSRLYYAVFHMASAVLLGLDIEVKTHAALQSLFAQHVVRAGLVAPDCSRRLAALFGVRQQADYNRHFTIDDRGAREELAGAREIIAELEAVLRARGVIDAAGKM
jgi:uncharacterized protein (UPF0332 family)